VSDRFFGRLFLVPLIIVIVATFILLGFSWLVRGSHSPEEFLKNLCSNNADVRWRAASDLSQVLRRDDQLAANPKFALDIAELLRQAVQTSAREEEDLARQPERPTKEQEREKLRPARNHVLYLMYSLGNFSVPVGVPLLSELAVKEQGGDPAMAAWLRWRALLSLANAGESLKRFDKLTPAQQEATRAGLGQEAGGERGAWAAAALKHLRARQEGRPDVLGVDRPLIQCADDENPLLREVAALAMNFWEGTAAENGPMDEALVRLTYDDGRGGELADRLLAEFDPDNQRETHPVQADKGVLVRYNAAVALARRGSGLARTDLLRAMLDEPRQRANFRLRNVKTGQESADEATAYNTLLTTLKAVAVLHRRNPGLDLSPLHPALDALKQSPNAAVRTQAEQTRIELDK
jgi:hypothetical protein